MTLTAHFLCTLVDTADQMTATLLQLLRFYFLPRIQYNTTGHLIGQRTVMQGTNSVVYYSNSENKTLHAQVSFNVKLW